MKLSNEAKKLIKNKIVRIYGGEDSHGHYWCADAENIDRMIEESMNKLLAEFNSAK